MENWQINLGSMGSLVKHQPKAWPSYETKGEQGMRVSIGGKTSYSCEWDMSSVDNTC